MKKFTRATLKSLIKKGLVEVRVRSNYTDDYAYDAAVNYGRTEWKPAVFSETGRDYTVEGESITFGPELFRCVGGRAWEDGDQMGLALHHFLYFDFRRKAA
ncbi:MAG: hypothetical protein E6R03_13865 [Hyphomicrobiaceae bacterium]|nr:MAG: hypothetical protein E6R03_13865 [Hyphomicrobiaceae bacterium]